MRLNMDARALVTSWAAQVDGDGCYACGYLFTDPEEGCDDCAPVKAVVIAAKQFKEEEAPTTHERTEQ